MSKIGNLSKEISIFIEKNLEFQEKVEKKDLDIPFNIVGISDIEINEDSLKEVNPNLITFVEGTAVVTFSDSGIKMKSKCTICGSAILKQNELSPISKVVITNIKM